MKNSVLPFMLFLLLGNVVCSQPIPADSLYLGQTPPGKIPQLFNLSVRTGSFAAERIVISNDGKEIYYSEIQNYYPVVGDTIKYYRYTAGGWTGPFVLFQGYFGPSLSLTSDTIYYQNSEVETFLSVKSGTNWINQKKILSNISPAHYLQVTNSGKYYISSEPDSGIGGSDWCTLIENGNDTIAKSLGLPVNSGSDNLDFFVSRDESFMILAKSGLQVSFHKNDGSWTNPKNLGPQINFGLGMWGPYVSSDNKYLFYTTGTHSDYSDTYVYWVRIDSLLDSLRNTNFIPYQNHTIPNQTDTVGNYFNFTIPDSTFIDDDGNNTLTLEVGLSSGGPLPAWLTFDTLTNTFYGTPLAAQVINIKIRVTDEAGATFVTLFKIFIKEPSGIGQINEKKNQFLISPNPSNGNVNVYDSDRSDKFVILEISSLNGSVILKDKFKNQINIDFCSHPKGIYLFKMVTDNEVATSRVLIE